MKQVICITGGANGLGRELAAYFSPKHHVVIFDIDPKVEIIANKLDCGFKICDVSDFESYYRSINEVIEKFHRIDCFINNAGVFIDGPIELNNSKLIRQVFEVNCLGSIFSTKILVPIFKKQKSGTIININSTAGFHPKAFNSVYHASKAALTSFSESIQLELANTPVKMIDIHPGVMKTKFTQKTSVDLSHAINPEEVVKTIDFVLSLDPKVTIPRLTIKHI